MVSVSDMKKWYWAIHMQKWNMSLLESQFSQLKLAVLKLAHDISMQKHTFEFDISMISHVSH